MFLDPYLYSKVHILIILGFTIVYYLLLRKRGADSIIEQRRKSILILIYSFVFIVVVGLRPVSSAFGDTVSYARIYEYFAQGAVPANWSSDTLFDLLMMRCSKIMGYNGFLLINEILYIIPMVFACGRFFKNNQDIGILVCMAAFSFFSYGVNGIRQGVACSLVLLALSFIEGNVWNKILCVILSFIAMGFHASAALPAVCMVMAFFVWSPRFMFIFWGLSVVISLVAGEDISLFISQFGFDERMSTYIEADVDEEVFSHTGFRVDFLLYSVIPIIEGYYLVFKKRVLDRKYLLLLGTYIYANAFWIMVIRAQYSNRFAYLSWFLYPIVLIYPLIKIKLWPKTQGHKLSILMIAHLAFTLFMTFIYYY